MAAADGAAPPTARRDRRRCRRRRGPRWRSWGTSRRRLGDAPVLLLVRASARPAWRTLHDTALEVVEVDPLDEGAVAGLLADRRVRAGLSGHGRARSARSAPGNPLLAIELFELLIEQGATAAGSDVPRRESLPATLDEVIAWRVAPLTGDARAALETVALIPQGAAPSLVGAVLRFGRSRCDRGARDGGGARIPRCRRGPGRLRGRPAGGSDSDHQPHGRRIVRARPPRDRHGHRGGRAGSTPGASGRAAASTGTGSACNRRRPARRPFRAPRRGTGPSRLRASSRRGLPRSRAGLRT